MARARVESLRQHAHVPVSLTERPQGFSDSDGFTPEWWTPRLFQDHSTLLAVADENGTVVARVEMVDRTYPGHYLGVVESPDFIKIQLIEVRSGHRRQGLGRATVDLLAERYSNRRLLAFSKADEFWESLGWNRHIHRDDDPARPRHQVLFIQP